MDAENRSTEGSMRLQRFLARAGVASRRASETLITEGRVSVNGNVITELGTKVDPERDEVTCDGAPVQLHGGSCVLMLHKPAGYLTAMADDRGRACVASLVPTEHFPGLFPVGRLDRDTTGLLLFTDDGDLGNYLLHPSHHVNKVYEAQVEGTPSERDVDRLRRGVRLEDGMTAPALVSLRSQGGVNVLEITIHEGRKRQVKRMCSAVGHPVVALHRSAFGPLRLAGLPEGAWRELSPGEVLALRRAAEGA